MPSNVKLEGEGSKERRGEASGNHRLVMCISDQISQN